MHAPHTPRLHALKRIIRYLQGTHSRGMQLRKNNIDQLVAYSDADWQVVLTLEDPPQGIVFTLEITLSLGPQNDNLLSLALVPKQNTKG